MVGGVGPRQEMFYSVDYKLPRKPGDGYSAGWHTHSGTATMFSHLCAKYMAACIQQPDIHTLYWEGGLGGRFYTAVIGFDQRSMSI